MKKDINPGLAIILLVTILFAACNKPGAGFLPPHVNAGKDTVITLPVNSVVLDGSASTDDENNIVHYQWKLFEGPSEVSIAKPNSAQTRVENLVKGIYYFELSVLDKVGYESRATVQVIVWDPQHKNTKAVKDTTIQLPYNRAILKTIDANIYKNTINWKKISGPGSFSMPFLNFEPIIVSNLVEGVYKFELTSTYWNNLNRIDTMTVTVLPDKNIYTSEKIFKKVVGKENGNNISFTIDNASSIIPAGLPFKLYIKSEVTADWEIVIPEGQYNYLLYTYRYSIINNAVIVYWDCDCGLGSGYNLNLPIKIVY